MANNTYVNKVVFGNDTLLDLTSDTVTANDVVSGVTFHDKTGAPLTGQFSPSIKAKTIKNGSNYFSSRVQYSVDISAELPDKYSQLTLGNFGIDGGIGLQASSSNPGTSDTDLFKSYDASTGILSLGRRVGRQTIGGTNYYLSLNYYVVVYYI